MCFSLGLHCLGVYAFWTWLSISFPMLGEFSANIYSTGDPPTLAGSFDSVSSGVTVRIQDYGSPIIKSHRTSRSDPLGIPSLFVGSPGWEVWHGAQNLHNSGRTSLALLFSGLWFAHWEGVGFDFIIIVPSCHLAVASSLSLDVRCLWWVPASSWQWLFNS